MEAIIKRKEVKTFVERAMCPQCGGEFVVTMTLTSFPPQYVHECDGCHISMQSRTSYPSRVLEEIDEKEE